MGYYDEDMECYERDSYGRMQYEVSFVYTDYAEDEEPELEYYVVWAYDKEDAINKVEDVFTSIEIMDVKHWENNIRYIAR